MLRMQCNELPIGLERMQWGIPFLGCLLKVWLNGGARVRIDNCVAGLESDLPSLQPCSSTCIFRLQSETLAC